MPYEPSSILRFIDRSSIIIVNKIMEIRGARHGTDWGNNKIIYTYIRIAGQLIATDGYVAIGGTGEMQMDCHIISSGLIAAFPNESTVIVLWQISIGYDLLILNM